MSVKGRFQFINPTTGQREFGYPYAAGLADAIDVSIQDADGSNTGAAVQVDATAAAKLILPSTIKATIKGNADTATNSTKLGGETLATVKSGYTTAISNHNTDTSAHADIRSIISALMDGSSNPAATHNAFYRGKDLTSYWESGEMSKAIQAGTFTDIYPGDYITKSVTINGTAYTVKWIVGDLDYHLGMGDTETTAHHALMFAESRIFTAAMNATNVTTGAYVNSNMWKTTIPLVATGIQNAFGSAHVLSHRELLANASSDTVASGAGAGWVGGSTNWTWCSVIANIFNEPMVYGGKVLSSSFYDVGECNSQIAAFRHNHGLIAAKRTWNWLRAVASSAYFCASYDSGDALSIVASHAGGGVRPYFLLH